MSLPNETLDESGATTEQGVDETHVAADSSTALREFITERPVAAALASAAVGAGLVAVLILATRETADAGRLGANAPPGDAAADSFARLKSQVAELAKSLAAALPTTDKVSTAIDASKGSVQDTLSGLREQTEDLMDRLRPYASATADMARAYPLWTSVAVGVLGALLGSQLLGGSAHDKVAPPAD